MTVDREGMKRIAQKYRDGKWKGMGTELLVGLDAEIIELDAKDLRIADLATRLATAHDMIRHFEQERDSWGAAYKQRAAKTDARIKELEALRDQLFRQRAQTRDIIHALPSVMVAAIAERCRGSPLPCFCGCHVSQADSLLPSEET